VPIPSTRKLERLEENIGAVDIELTADDLREVDEAAAKITIHGAINPPDPRHGITLFAAVSEFLSAPRLGTRS
jgi:diketogulonate reductase-like aldo/keto reductase